MNASSSPHTSARLRAHDERGASPASVIILLTSVLMFVELIVMGGRIAAANNQVNGAAREAAREASILQYASSVNGVADSTARANLQEGTDHCRYTQVSTSGTVFRQGGRVRVQVSCTVDLSDFSFLSIPWPAKAFRGEAVEVVETYRAVE